MTDPNGPPAWNPGGWPQQPGPTDADPTRYPGQGSDPNQPYPGQQYPGHPQQGYPTYPETQYPGQPYSGQPQQGSYPGYPTQQAAAETYAAHGQPGYPPQYGAPQYGAGQHGAGQYGAGQYGGAPYGAGQYGAPQGAPRGASKVWIIVAAVVAAVAVAAGVVVVVLLNRAPDPDVVIAEGVSTPGSEIPDGSPSGLTDTITLDGGDTTVGRLEVSVQFEHRYPTEITGVLTGPGGRQAVVVARGSETSIRTSTTDPASPLQNLVGEPVSGAWRLTLTDGVNVDTGRLVRWDVTAYPAAGDAPAQVEAPQSATSAPGLAIPDDTEAGVSDTIALSGYGDVQRITVSARITHDVQTDLLVALRSPTGQLVTLTDHADFDTLALDSSAAGSPLSALVGQPVAGPWELEVVDDVILDEGTLVDWEITVNG